MERNDQNDGWKRAVAFGAFVNHFPVAAGLLFSAVRVPDRVLAFRAGWLK